MAKICIITPSGMICSSSPLKFHHPAGKPCVDPFPNPQDSKAQKVKKGLPAAGCTSDEQDIIGTVAELMLAADVKKGQPFTIVAN